MNSRKIRQQLEKKLAMDVCWSLPSMSSTQNAPVDDPLTGSDISRDMVLIILYSTSWKGDRQEDGEVPMLADRSFDLGPVPNLGSSPSIEKRL